MKHLRSSAAVLLLLAASPALAQPAQPAPSPADSIKISTSPTIVVRTSRIVEPLYKTAAAVTYVPNVLFQNGRHYELKEALWNVPGVLTQARSGHTDQRITIRGYGARGAGNRSNAGNMRGIRVNIDGIPETEPDGRTSLDLVNLDATGHLEVLRSNSSTLYGSASGGVINIYSNTEFTDPFIETRNLAGSYNFMRNAVTAGAVLGDGSSKMIFSLSNTTFGDSTRKAYREHSSASQLLFTVAVNSRLGERTQMNVSAGGTSNLFRFPGPLTYQQFLDNPEQANATFVARDERRFNRQGRLAFSLDHGINEEHTVSGALFYQPKVLERSERNTYRDFNRYGLGAQGRYNWKHAFSSAVQSSFTAGFDQQYQDGTVLFWKLSSSAGRSDTIQQNKQEGALTMGGYIDQSVTIDSAWTVRVGARYDRVLYTFRNFLAPGSSGPAQRKEFTHVTPKIGLSYRLPSNHTLYAAVGGGLEAPAFNEVDPPSDSLVLARGGEIDGVNTDFNPIIEPSTSISYEIGGRGVVSFDGPVTYISYDAAAYMISINNDLVPWNGGSFYFTAAKTRRIGAELGLTVGTDIGLRLMSALTVGESHYIEYENNLGRFDDNFTAGLPGFFANARLRYDAPLGFFAEIGLEHVGEYYADDRNDKLADGSPDTATVSLVPSYTLLGGTLGWNYSFGPLGVELFATMNNIADTRYVSSVFINGERNEYFEPGLGRNVVVGLGLRYTP